MEPDIIIALTHHFVQNYNYKCYIKFTSLESSNSTKELHCLRDHGCIVLRSVVAPSVETKNTL